MTYIALLRGINVGGNNKVEMPRLKAAFVQLGFSDVTTYINSGNVIFNDQRSKASIKELVEDKLEQEFNLSIPTLIIDKPTLETVAAAIPQNWHNDKAMKCDIMFLWEDKNNPRVIEELKITPKIDLVKYVNGALMWCVNRQDVTKSGILKLIGTPLYKKMTIRNCNTVRALRELADGVS